MALMSQTSSLFWQRWDIHNVSGFDSYLDNHRTRGNDTFCPLFGLQGRTGRILLSHSQRFILSRGLDKDKRSAFVYPGQMHVCHVYPGQMAFAIVCQASRLWQGSWHKLYIGKEDEIWIGCEYWLCSKWFLSWWLQTWSYCCKKIVKRNPSPIKSGNGPVLRWTEQKQE